MKIFYRSLIAYFALSIVVSVHAADDTSKHAFKKTYDQLLSELPNVQSQLSETSDDVEKIWVGTVPLGRAKALIKITGKNKDKLTSLSMTLVCPADAETRDYDNLEALRDVLFQGLIGSGDTFDLVNAFWAQEFRRQERILKAGGVPTRGTKKYNNGTTELSVQLSRQAQGLSSYFAIQLH
ncbi:hypothetical protein [Pseudomonas sp. FP833]|uniref:hypothetical protein n=1 Tax=Pseudomonas sp. FP833 TaxID=2954102 RepID=UPI002732D614|nr:hypothetical protein [Pseudomonas sp. FP833]WLI50631.1 hypothetical protein PSH63_30290 [Pseudomonas sp. FP833]